MERVETLFILKNNKDVHFKPSFALFLISVKNISKDRIAPSRMTSKKSNLSLIQEPHLTGFHFH